MKIAVEGCAHGELEKIYDTIQSIEKEEHIKVDLLLCCGDFQATRNLDDLQTMAVPKKYQDICSFYKYYSGEKIAPILTIFIGGNHEASNYLQELPYGGWVAPNIYYMGYAGVVLVNGIRIAGISGIYKGHDFLRGHHEFAPFSEGTKKSVYHVRQLEVYRMKQLSGKIDVFMSHDWPRGIYNYGNKAQLVRFKPHFRDEVEQDQLGSRPCEELLMLLKPSHWFAAHLHCKFAAIVCHDNDESSDNVNDNTHTEPEPTAERITKFLALDKCLPKRRFLQLLDINSLEHTDEGELKFEHDLEWLTILYLTNHLINVKSSNHYMPGAKSGINSERYNFTPTAEEMEHVRRKFGGDLCVPKNFCRTVEPFSPNEIPSNPQQPKAQINPQSLQFCDTLGIDDPLSLAMLINGHELSHSSTLDSSDINDSSLMLGEQSIWNSSTECEQSVAALLEQSSPNKRKSSLGLSLPQPVSNQNTSKRSSPPLLDSLPLSDSPIPLHKTDQSTEAIQSSDCVEDKTTDNAQIEISEDLKAEQQLPLECGSKPPIKKFKRRNLEIYKDNDEEE